MSIQPELTLTDYAGNKSQLSLSQQPLVGHKVRPAIAKDSPKRPGAYRWLDFVSNDLLLRETQMRCVTCIVCEHQLRLYGYVARFPDADPAHQILLVMEP